MTRIRYWNLINGLNQKNRKYVNENNLHRDNLEGRK